MTGTIDLARDHKILNTGCYPINFTECQSRMDVIGVTGGYQTFKQNKIILE